MPWLQMEWYSISFHKLFFLRIICPMNKEEAKVERVFDTERLSESRIPP